MEAPGGRLNESTAIGDENHKAVCPPSLMTRIHALATKIFRMYWNNYVALALTGALNISLSSLCMKVVARHASSFQAYAFRGCSAGFILLLYCRSMKLKLEKPAKKLPFVIARGAFGSAAFICIGLAAFLLPISDVGFLSNSYPVVTTVLARIMGMERPNYISLLGVAGCFVGNLLASKPPFLVGSSAERWDLNRGLGLMFALLYSLLLGFTIIITRLGGDGIPVATMTLSSHVFLVLYSVPFLMAAYPKPLQLPSRVEEIACYGVLLLCGTLFLAAQTRAFQIGPPTKTTCLLMVNMLFTTLYGRLFFSEHLSWISAVGAVTIILSVLAVVSQRQRTVINIEPESVPEHAVIEIEQLPLLKLTDNIQTSVPVVK